MSASHGKHTAHYHRCPQCDLVMQVADELPTPAAEKALYDQHENDLGDPGYRRFLAPVRDAVLARYPQPARGLDFGAGPAPALAAMLREAGHDMAVYDPFYANDSTVLEQRYDFVVCTEAVEHFHVPRTSLELLFSLLRPAGELFVMTRLLLPDVEFASWWYPRDPTHVAFYSPQCLQWIASWQGRPVTLRGDRLAHFGADRA
ncbi:MAG: methyltransferase domain-containing protein [Gammaproteobacteria bacterium]|nr:methyltransferase domain-containing protein [Gammaproteobacteria bacterium]